eukprot:SAG22_NODE_747_length_7495_cov_7.582342_1_plen_85_part_00
MQACRRWAAAAGRVYGGLKDDLGLLRSSSPRELWVIMLMVCCSAFTYNTMANVMTVFATAEYGFSDVETGDIVRCFAGTLPQHL